MENSRMFFAQSLSVFYECALAIGNSLNLAEMLHQVINTIVQKTSAAYGIIWVRNGEEELQPVASAGIRISDALAGERIDPLRSVLQQIQQRGQFVLRDRDEKDFLQYLTVPTGKEEAVLIVPVGNVAILHLVYASRETVDETLGNMLAGLSPKLNVAIGACRAHENIIKEIRVREETENELRKKADEMISNQKELQRLYAESEEARRSLLSILEDVTEKGNTLRISEEKYRNLIDRSQDVIYLLYEGKFELINQRFKELLGYTLEEVNAPDFHFMKLVAPKSRGLVEERVQKVYRGEAVPPRYEFTALTRDGSEIEVETSVSYIPYKGGIAAQGVLRDITERKRAQERIERLNIVLRAIRNINQIITREKDCERLLEGACKILIETRGYHRAWIAILNKFGGLVKGAESRFGKDFSSLRNSWKSGMVPICVQKVLWHSDVVMNRVSSSSDCAGCPLREEHPVRTTIKARLVHAGRVYGVLSASYFKDVEIDEEELSLFSEVARDIALALHDIELEETHQQAQKRLQESEERHRAILGNIKEGYYEVDIAGNFTFFNDSLCRIIGYSADELMGMNNRQCTDAENARKLYQVFNAVYRTGETVKAFDWEIIRKDGTKRFAEVSVWLIRNSTGETTGFGGIIRDITERKALQEKLEKLYAAEKNASQKLEEELRARCQLINVLAHEVRMPLTPVMISSEMLRDILSSNPESTHFKLTNNILNSTQAMVSCLDELLDMARFSAGTFILYRQALDIRRFLEETASEFQPVIEHKGQYLIKDLPPILPIIQADPSRLQQALLNLLSNASKFSPEGKNITLRARTEGNELVIEIEDQGIGISPKEQESLFKPYHRVQPDRHALPGMGLGLAIARQIIGAHGGRIWLTSEPGQGSTFCFSLPVGGWSVVGSQ
jgi:PAS domain S-box-containing protein